MEHRLKTWPAFFGAVLDRRKRHELRRNDRGYAVGDVLILQEFEPAAETYTGREQRVVVTYITSPETPCAVSNTALASGYAILSIRPENTGETEA